MDPAEILFERKSLRGRHAPGDEARPDIAGALSASLGGGRGGGPRGADDNSAQAGHLIAAPLAAGSPSSGGFRNDADTAANLIPSVVATLDANYGKLHGCSGQDAKHGHSHLIPVAYGSNNTSGPVAVASALNAHTSATGRLEFTTETFIVEPIPFDTTQITHPENRSNPKPGDPSPTLATKGHPPVIAFHGSQDPDPSGGVTHPLGTNYGLEACIAFEPRMRGDDGRGYDRGPNFMVEIAPTLNTVKQPAIAFQTRGSNIHVGEISGTIGTNADRASGSAPCIAFTCKDHGQDAGVEIAPTLRAMTGEHHNAGGQVAATVTMGVRRLLPHECERLQAFPDGFTNIRYRGKSDAPDGPRYRALGNSMTVTVMEWIGRRIDRQIRRRA